MTYTLPVLPPDPTLSWEAFVVQEPLRIAEYETWLQDTDAIDKEYEARLARMREYSRANKRRARALRKEEVVRDHLYNEFARWLKTVLPPRPPTVKKGIQ